MFIYRSSAFILRVIFGGRAGKSADLKFKCIQLSSPQPTNPSPHPLYRIGLATLFLGASIHTLFSRGRVLHKENKYKKIKYKKYNCKSPYLLPLSTALEHQTFFCRKYRVVNALLPCSYINTIFYLFVGF